MTLSIPKLFLWMVAGLIIQYSLQANEIPFESKIYIAGHNGLVGSALLRKLKGEGYENIITRNSSELDLRNQRQVC